MEKTLEKALKKILAEKEKWTIRDWAGNYPFEKNPHQSAVKLGGGPVETWDSFDDAEDFLSEHLGDAYETDRGEYEIELVEASLKKAQATDPKTSLKAPKEWWDKMFKKVKKANPDYSDDQIRKTIGDVWNNKLTEAKKKEIRKRYGKKYGPAKKAASSLEYSSDPKFYKKRGFGPTSMETENWLDDICKAKGGEQQESVKNLLDSLSEEDGANRRYILNYLAARRIPRPKTSEAAFPIHPKDDILKGFTYETLIDAVTHNEKTRDEAAIKKVFKELLVEAIDNAKESLKKDMGYLVEQIRKASSDVESSCDAMAAVGSDAKHNFAVQIEGVDPEYYLKSFAQQLEDIKIIKSFQQSAKTDHIDAKGKSTLAAVKAWLKENKPKQYYAKWQKDSSNYKDDSVEIFWL